MQQNVRLSRNGEELIPQSLSLCSALDQTRQVDDLYRNHSPAIDTRRVLGIVGLHAELFVNA
jgi:hypothetical protein